MIQIGYVSILKAIQQYKEESGRNFLAYAMTAVKNNYYYEVRQKCRMNDEASLNTGKGEVEDWLNNIADDMEIEKIILRRENVQEVHKILSKLSEEEKEMIYAIYFHEIPLKKFAEWKEIKYISLIKRRSRVLAKLRKELEMLSVNDKQNKNLENKGDV